MIVKEISVDNFDDVLLSIKNFVISSDIKEKGILISIPAIYKIITTRFPLYH